MGNKHSIGRSQSTAKWRRPTSKFHLMSTTPFWARSVCQQERRSPTPKMAVRSCEWGKEYARFANELRIAAGISAGEHIVVTTECDAEEGAFAIAVDRANSISANGRLDAFEAFSYLHSKEYMIAVEVLSRPAARVRRIGRAIEMVTEKTK